MQLMSAPGLGRIALCFHGPVDLRRSSFRAMHIDMYVDCIIVNEFCVFQDTYRQTNLVRGGVETWNGQSDGRAEMAKLALALHALYAPVWRGTPS